MNDIDKLIASNPYFKDDGIKYWLVPPKGEYDFELAILFEDDYPDFTVLTWALNRKQTEGLFDGTTDLSMIRIPHLDLGIDDMDATRQFANCLRRCCAAESTSASIHQSGELRMSLPPTYA